MSSQLKHYQVNKVPKELIELPLSNLTFRSKSSLKAYTVLIIKGLMDKEIDEQHNSCLFFRDMINRHYEIKFEPGMIFVVHTNEGYDLDGKRSKERTPYRRSEPYRAYVYIPSIKKYRSFSLFNKCINGKNYSERELKNRDYRKSIEPQIQFVRRTRRWCCELCLSTKMLDVDHYPKTFNEIVQEFEQLNDGSSFESFHKAQVSYRILCRDCHIQNTRR